MLDFNHVHLMRPDDLNVRYRVGQCFPQVGNDNFIAHGKLIYMPEVIRPLPTPMTGNDAVGVVAASRS